MLAFLLPNQADRSRLTLKEIEEACTSGMKQQFSPILEGDVKNKLPFFGVGNLRQSDGTFIQVEPLPLVIIERRIEEAKKINSPTLLQICTSITVLAFFIFVALGSVLGLAGLALTSMIILTGGLGCKVAVMTMFILNILPKRKRKQEVQRIINELAQQHIIAAQKMIWKVKPRVSNIALYGSLTPDNEKSTVYTVFEFFSKEGNTAKAIAAVEEHFKLSLIEREFKRTKKELEQKWGIKPTQPTATT